MVQVGQPFFKTREALDGSGLVEACKRDGLDPGLGVRLSANYLVGVALPALPDSLSFSWPAT